MQSALTAGLVLWAACYTFAVLSPMRSRRLRGWLARQADGHLPAAWVQRIRPGFPVTHCGCGDTCAPVRNDAPH